MSVLKVAVALGGAAVLAGGLAFAGLSGGTDDAPKATPPQVTATSVVAVTASSEDAVNSILSLTQQLQQAANNNGSPRPLTPEEVNAALQVELAKLGIKL